MIKKYLLASVLALSAFTAHANQSVPEPVAVVNAFERCGHNDKYAEFRKAIDPMWRYMLNETYARLAQANVDPANPITVGMINAASNVMLVGLTIEEGTTPAPNAAIQPISCDLFANYDKWLERALLVGENLKASGKI